MKVDFDHQDNHKTYTVEAKAGDFIIGEVGLFVSTTSAGGGGGRQIFLSHNPSLVTCCNSPFYSFIVGGED